MNESDAGGAGALIGLAIIAIIYSSVEALREELGLSWGGLFFYCLLGSVLMASLLYTIQCFAEDPRETTLMLTLPIWAPHYLLAWGIVMLVRNPLILRWGVAEGFVRELIITWLRVVPPALGMVWGVVVASFLLASGMVWWLALLLTVAACTLLIVQYYDIYFQRQPRKSPAWRIYLAEYHRWGFDKRLDDIRRNLRI